MHNEMTLSEAKQFLREHNYRVTKVELLLDESATDQLNKVKDLLGKWGKKLFAAKKEDDKEQVADVVDDVEELKSEIYDKGLLNKFRNNKGLGKAIFGAMAILMLAGGAANAHAAANAQPYLGGSHSAPTAQAFGSAMDDLDFYCGGDSNCSVDINGDDVTVHKGGETTHHSYAADHQGSNDKGSSDGIKISVDSQRERDVGRHHGTMFTVIVNDSDGAHAWNIFQSDDGKVAVDNHPERDNSKLVPASDKQIAWLNAHGNNFLK